MSNDPYKWDQGLEAYSQTRVVLRQFENELENTLRVNPDDTNARKQLKAIRAKLAEEPTPDDPDGERILDKAAELIETVATPFEAISGLMRELNLSRAAAERWIMRMSEQRLPMVRAAGRLIIIRDLLRIASKCQQNEELQGRAIYALEKAAKACEDPKEVATELRRAAETLKGPNQAPATGKAAAERFGSEGVFYLMAMKCVPPDQEALDAWIQAGRPGLANAMPTPAGEA